MFPPGSSNKVLRMIHLSPRLTVTLLALLAMPAARALEFRFLAWDEKVAARPVAVIDGKDKEAAIKDLHPLKRSPRVSADLHEGSLLLRALDRKNTAGKPVDFNVVVPAEMTHPLVLLVSDTKAESGLRGLVLEDNTTNFPWGTFRFLNASGKDLGVALGSLRKALPAAWQPVDLLPGGDKALPVEIAMGDKDGDGSLKPLYASMWKADPDVRRLVFVTLGTTPRLGALDIKIIPEDRKQLAIEAGGAAGEGGGAGAGVTGGASSRSAEHQEGNDE